MTNFYEIPSSYVTLHIYNIANMSRIHMIIKILSKPRKKISFNMLMSFVAFNISGCTVYIDEVL